MPIPITPERLARRTAIAAILREHGPQTSRQIYSRCGDMPDITEVSRLIHEMRKVGEIHTEGKVHWIAEGTNGKENVSAHADDPLDPAEPPGPEGELVTDAEFEALTERSAKEIEPDEPDKLLLWYSSEGDMRIGFEGEVPLALTAADVEALVAFLRRVELVK